MSIGNFLTQCAIKTAGVAGIGILGLDAHKEGKRQAKIYKRIKNNEAFEYYYKNSRHLNSPSYVNMKLKDRVFRWEKHNDLRGFINSKIGYLQGVGNMLLEDVVPWGLSLAALLTKGTASKVSGVALAAYSGYSFLKNVCGFGVVDHK